MYKYFVDFRYMIFYTGSNHYNSMCNKECQTTRPADNSDRDNSARKRGQVGPLSEDKSARMLRQLGPYYCFIILFNIYMCIIIYLFKRQLLSFSEKRIIY